MNVNTRVTRRIKNNYDSCILWAELGVDCQMHRRLPCSKESCLVCRRYRPFCWRRWRLVSVAPCFSAISDAVAGPNSCAPRRGRSRRLLARGSVSLVNRHAASGIPLGVKISGSLRSQGREVREAKQLRPAPDCVGQVVDRTHSLSSDQEAGVQAEGDDVSASLTGV
jgi:hypothetical protein